jgi:acetylornithine deacetylase/succinyl-diaminopimelate desuccinylase family protein
MPSYLGDDPVLLTQALTRINSANPGLSTLHGAGETEIAKYIAAWLQHHGIEHKWVEETSARPSVIGIVRGTGGGKSLMFNGHIDTVTLAGYEGDPLSGLIDGDVIEGRGTMDMKAGIAASMVALKRVKDLELKGDVILAAVADEENLSIGTEQILAAGWKADAAIVPEPSGHDIVVAHKGFVWLEVEILGVAAHGSRPGDGVDSITKSGKFLVQLEEFAKVLNLRTAHPQLGHGIIHAGLIKGGEEPSSIPAKTVITIERRTLPRESAESVTKELTEILEKIACQDPDFRFDVRVTFERTPFEIPQGDGFVDFCTRKITEALGEKPIIRAESAWTDCALLSDAGIPTILFGPKGDGLHGKYEWASVSSIRQVTDALSKMAEEFCA